MARVVVTYATGDRPLVNRMEEWLEREGHSVVPLRGLRLSGEGLKNRAINEIGGATHVLALLSHNSWATQGFAFELGLVRNLELAIQRNVLIGAAVDDAPVPTVLGSRPVVRISSSEPEASFDTLLWLLNEPVGDAAPAPRTLQRAQTLVTTEAAPPAWSLGIADLTTALRTHQLVLFLGAGVSCSAGVPNWQTLVDRVMGTVFGRAAMASGLEAEKLAAVMRTQTKSSDLILAEHARRELGSDFYTAVQAELYRGATGRSSLLSALGELAARRRPRAAVTYNFDIYFEEELGRRGIPNKTITGENDRFSAELPVFHVHGVVRPSGRVKRQNLVFAESEFNAESLDPYRWSALVQLSHLSQSTCLFVGSSILDPNLRRLLEVVKKRSPENVPQHFVVYRRTDADELAQLAVLSFAQARRVAEVIDRLVEGGLNDLGLQVIWVSTHEEVADVVSDLAISAIATAA